MTRRPATRDELLQQLADHIAQLVAPYWHTEKVGYWDKNHNWKHRVESRHHDSLLDQLLAAAPSLAVTAGRIGAAFGSRDGANLEAIDRLTTIAHGTVIWLKTLGHAAARGDLRHDLRGLVGAAPAATDDQLRQLAADIHRWWLACRVIGSWGPQATCDTTCLPERHGDTS